MNPLSTLASSLPAVLNIQGKLLFPGQEAISVFDRSYLYGDSLYEVMRSYDGKILQSHLHAHLERLFSSAKLCKMTLNQTSQDYKKEIERTIEFFHEQPFGKNSKSDRPVDIYCRIIVSRGVGKIGFGHSQLLSPTLFSIIVQPVDKPSEAAHERGVHLKVIERIRNDRRALDPAMKSGNYLNSLLGYLESSEAGFDDALLADSEGSITEGTTFNVFYVRRNIICTPPLEVGILDGITRRTILRLAQENHLETREVRFPKERLYEADEVFISSTLKEVMAVTKIDQNLIQDGRPGNMTRKLRKIFQKEIQLEIQAEKQDS